MSEPRSVIDLHCHTDASFDCLAAPASVVRAAATRGLTHLAITDHDRIDGALRARDAAPPGLTVIIGEEVRTIQGDLICLFLESAIPSGMPVLETIEAARDQGALVGIPHPFDRHRASILLDPELEDLAGRIDWLETWNARIIAGTGNQQAAAFAEKHGLPGVAVSDAHSILEVSVAYSTMAGDPATSAGFREALPSVAHSFGEAPAAANRSTPIGRLIGRARAAGGAAPRAAGGAAVDAKDRKR